jgi:hypothetical protein
MWTMERLVDYANRNGTCAQINKKWVWARPENGKRQYATLRERVSDAWGVFICRAEAFTWPENQ